MNYQLSPEEMAQVRRLVALFEKSMLHGVLSAKDEEEAFALAGKIKEWLK